MTDLEQQILDFLSRPGAKPLKPAGLAKRLDIAKSQRGEFGEALERLIASGQVVERHGAVRAKSAPGLLAGTIKRTSSGAGFFIPHERPGGDSARSEQDVYIAPADLRDAHTGDEVLISLLRKRGRGGRLTGRVEEVLVRATNTFVGTYFEQADQGFVKVDGTAFHEAIYVGDPGAKGAQPGDKVVIEMLRFPMPYVEGEAVLTNVLGPRGEPGVDTQTVIHEFALPDEFPEDVLHEAGEQAARFDPENLDGRLDLTRETIVTIDPADARDFDDAISLHRSKDGHWHLGVHIADVAHFVQPGSRLDQEALLRGNSVYLPQRVLPMLPEVISNGLASLQKGKVRYTKSAQIEFNPEGIPVHTELANSAIKVTRRFAYEDVLPIIREPERFRTQVPAKVRKLLAEMHELAMILRQRRFAAGALELSLREVKLDIGKDGKIVGAHEASHDESHQIIEEFMLAANTAVATELSDRRIPFLRRVHGEPDPLKLKAFAGFVTVLGYPLKLFHSRRHLQTLLDRVKGEPPEHAVNYALLRSMKQAEYAAVEMGHYALAVENYCHFTSPIRRYPDLAVHRLIDQIVSARQAAAGRRRGKTKVHAPNDLEVARLGKHCSTTERRAAAAERELIKIKLLEFMAERVGEELDTVITGVEQFGIFCRGIEIPVEGLIHISALDPGDYFYFDATAFSLVGRATGKQYRLGDTVRVSVARVDVDRRELEFKLVASGRRKSERPKEHRDDREWKDQARDQGAMQVAHNRRKEARRPKRRR